MYLHGVFEGSGAKLRVELRPRRSQELRESPELQNDGLRALEEAWMRTFIQVEALLESLDGRVLDASGGEF